MKFTVSYIVWFCLFFFNNNFLLAQVNLAKGLVAYYPFNGNANDASGNNIHGITNSVLLTHDANNKLNSAFEFNGTTSYISLPYNAKYNFAPTDSFSISCWIQPYSNTLWAAAQALIVKSPFNTNYQNSNWNYGLYLALDKAMSGYASNEFLNSNITMQQSSCWYHIVVTYKNGVWYLYVNGKIESQDLSQTKFILQDGTASTIAFGRKGDANGDYYKGKLDEVRIYNRNLSGLEVDALYRVEKNLAEFSFVQDKCNPKQIAFKNETINYSKFYWRFNGSAVDSNNINPIINFNNYSNYNIQLITVNNYNCYDTISKTVSVQAIEDVNLILNTNDTAFCAGKSIQLKIKDTGNTYCWSSSNNSFSGSNYNPMLSPTTSTTYYLFAQTLNSNLILNGDFEQGNLGFETDYTYHPGTAGGIQGIYHIASNPNVWLSAFSACSDNTPGIGNDKMMMVDASTVANKSFWLQNIAIKPNTNYIISYWIQSIVSENPPTIKLKVNGKQIGTSFTATTAACNFKKYEVQWYSDNLSKITLSLEDSNTIGQGNDFAVDDISMRELMIFKDSINVNVNTAIFDSIYREICFGDSLNGHKISGIYKDTLTSVLGCDSICVLNLKVLPKFTVFRDTISGCGSVIVNAIAYSSNQVVTTTIKSYLGCDSIINEHQIIITTIKDTIEKNICIGQTYWGHSSSFDTTFKLANNCDSILHIFIKNGAYIRDTITKWICKGDSFLGYKNIGYYSDTFKTLSCDSIRVLQLIHYPVANPKLQQDTSICEGDFLVLQPGKFKKYLWSNGLQDAEIKVKNVGLYWVQITDSFNCKATDSFKLIDVFLPPKNFITTRQLTTCLGQSFPLTGFSSYLWNTGETTPTINLNGLSNYWVEVVDSNGCLGKDSLLVNYSTKFEQAVVNAFSPNGDGNNDEFKPFSNSSCFKKYSIIIFNRWGQKVFEKLDPNKGWDGMLSGKQLSVGIYYYIINYETTTGLSNQKTGCVTLLR